ncbi:MAG: hypothetical protein LBJ92_00370 [Holosporales bacterium]|nr:hypothetical protein [Holosporales bacterium]
MKGETARRTAVYLSVHQGDEYKYSSTVSTQQKAYYVREEDHLPRQRFAAFF